MCTWRRSLKIATQNKKIVTVANKRRKLRWIFLTLTVKNVQGAELKSTINHMMQSWNRFMGYKRIKDSVTGWFRGLEVTRDTDRVVTKERYSKNPKYYKSIGVKPEDKNPNFNTYHPHFHILICVSTTYFSKKGEYIKQEEWTELWKKAAQLDYRPIVDVRPVKAGHTKKSIFEVVSEIENAISEQKAVFEISKYPVKDTDIMNLDDVEESAEIVKILDHALDRKRLIAYGGILKDIKKELGLTDVESEDADLIHIEENNEDEVAEEIEKVTAYWHYGLREYVISKTP